MLITSHAMSVMKKLLRAMVLTAVVVLCGACLGAPAPTVTPVVVPAPTATPGGRGSGGTLRVMYWQAPTILNPHLAAAIKDLEAGRLSYEPLASFGAYSAPWSQEGRCGCKKLPEQGSPG